MELSPTQLRELHQALLSAFPTTTSLQEMVWFGLGTNLATISTQSNLSAICMDLITWTEAQGRTAELIQKSREFNPGNPRLQAFAEKMAPADPVAPSKTDLDQRQKIYDVLMSRFTLGEIKTICFNLGIDYEVVEGTNKASKARGLITYLGHRNNLQALVEQIRKERGNVI